MGASDFPSPLPASSLVIACPRVRASCTPMMGPPWLPPIRNVRLDTASDSGACSSCLPVRMTAVACWLDKPIGTHQRIFRSSTPSRSASPVTLAPRLLSYLRINQPVTGLTARFDTGPVAGGYPGRDSHPLDWAAWPGRCYPRNYNYLPDETKIPSSIGDEPGLFQLVWLHAQRPCNLSLDVAGRLALAGFDHTDIATRHAGRIGDGFERQPAMLAPDAIWAFFE